MTREDIIRMAREANRYAASQTDDSLDFLLIRDERFAALVAALAEEQNYVNRWISVEENLPKEGQLVLGLYYKSNIRIVYRQARENIEDGWVEPSSGHSLIPPTHWTPLPEYKHVHKMESNPTINKVETVAPADKSMQRLTDVQQETDCYGDGNVYRGQRSSDSKTPTLTINGMPAVEGPLSKAHRTCQESPQVEPVAFIHKNFERRIREVLTEADFGGDKLAFLRYCMSDGNLLPLYAAPPKREPLTEAELEPIRRRMMMEAYNAADDGDSERYNALKVMANDVLDMLLGGEK